MVLVHRRHNCGGLAQNDSVLRIRRERELEVFKQRNGNGLHLNNTREALAGVNGHEQKYGLREAPAGVAASQYLNDSNPFDEIYVPNAPTNASG